MSCVRLCLTWVLAAFAVTCCGVSEATVIYSEDFEGLAAGNLHGTAPDTGPAGATWAASALWKANGTKPNGGRADAWLPFTPAAGQRYHLSLDVNPDIGNSTDWFAIGFSDGHSTTGWHTAGSQVHAWMLNRDQDSSSTAIQTFLGPDTGNGASHNLDPDIVGPVHLEVVLDTQGPNWTVEWLADGTSLRGPMAYTSNPTINYVGFGAWDSATGSVDNFTLADESSGPPPPAPFLEEVTLRLQATCDNHYQFFLSDSPTAQGTLIGQSGGDDGRDDWFSAEIFEFDVPAGKPLYLHVLGENNDAPNWGGFIADLVILEHPEYVFAETGTQRIATSPALWDMSVEGWGIDVADAISLGTYGISPWGTNADPDFLSDCHWLWNASSGNAADQLYLTLPFTVPSLIPEPTSLGLLALGGLGLLHKRRRTSRPA